MPFSLSVAVLTLCLATLGGQGANANPYSWSYRPVFLFAPSAAQPALQRQNAINEAAASALRDRDIVVVSIIGDRVSAQFGPEPDAGADELRRRYDVEADQFIFLLVGKDSGVKLRSDRPVSAQRLARVIDAMPMRQREMRARDND